jgi:four helix bundle protein
VLFGIRELAGPSDLFIRGLQSSPAGHWSFRVLGLRRLLQFLKRGAGRSQEFLTSGAGTSDASAVGMSVTRQYEELVSWQKMHKLHIEIDRATQDGSDSDKLDFRDQIRDAATSAERYIVDGFGRYNPVAFANVLEFSRTAAGKTRSLLRKGLDRGDLSAQQFNHLDQLAIGALRATVNFQRYLRSPAAKRHAPLHYPRPYSASPEHPANQSSTLDDAAKANT